MAGTTVPIVGTSGKIEVTVTGPTTYQHYYTGNAEINFERKTEETGPWIGNSNILEVSAGQKFTFKVSGHITPTGSEAATDSALDALMDAYYENTKPVSLVIDTILGKKFTFLAAATTYTKFTYKVDAKGSVTFEAEGSGVPTIAAGSAS